MLIPVQNNCGALAQQSQATHPVRVRPSHIPGAHTSHFLEVVLELLQPSNLLPRAGQCGNHPPAQATEGEGPEGNPKQLPPARVQEAYGLISRGSPAQEPTL